MEILSKQTFSLFFWILSFSFKRLSNQKETLGLDSNNFYG